MGWSRATRCLLVLPPDLVTDLLGDHAIANVEVVQETHADFRTDREGTVLETVAREPKRDFHVVKDPIRRSKPLLWMEFDVFDRLEDPQIHFLDARSAGIGDATSGCFPHRILGVEFDAFIDALWILLLKVHGNEV